MTTKAPRALSDLPIPPGRSARRRARSPRYDAKGARGKAWKAGRRR